MTVLTMVDTPRKSLRSPSKQPKQLSPSSIFVTPQTPQAVDCPRRSSRRLSLKLDQIDASKKPVSELEQPTKDPLVKGTPQKLIRRKLRKHESIKTPESNRDNESAKPSNYRSKMVEVAVSFSPLSPDQLETKKRRRGEEKERKVITRAMVSKSGKSEQKNNKKRVYYKKVVYDGGEFEVGDDVYVKRREDASSDNEEPEVEECRVCFKAGKAIMIECDDCLGGFHLKCLKPPLKEVPEGDWICDFCEAKKLGKEVKLPKLPEGKRLARTLREKLLSSDLWAARIERFYPFVCL